MVSHFKERFIRMLYPYVIVLRQGCNRPQDPFDFSLALLHRHSGETLPPPKPFSSRNAEMPIPKPQEAPKATAIVKKKRGSRNENSS